MDEMRMTSRYRREACVDVKIHLVDEKGTEADECGLWMTSRLKLLLIRKQSA